MLILQEIKIKFAKTLYIILKVYWKAFKNNWVTLELAHITKLLPCDKDINVVYNNLQKYAIDKTFWIIPINTFT